MNLTVHRCHDEEEYWHLRAFLRHVFLANDRREDSWHVARLDYWRAHVIADCHASDAVEQVTYIWETADGRIAAALNPESAGQAFLQVDPAFRTAELEEQMLDVAEQNLARPMPDSGRKLWVWTAVDDTLRQSVLRARGYEPVMADEVQEHHHRRQLGQTAPVTVPSGYVVRSMGDSHELPDRSWASWRAFHADEPGSAYEGWEWYLDIQHAPLYRQNLDIVAVTKDGVIAAFCTVWYDDVTRTGYIEPVGAVPEHQRHGLGRAVLSEGLARLWSLGATMALVAGQSPEANALYDAVVGPDYLVSEPWAKELGATQIHTPSDSQPSTMRSKTT
jgi:GNAT superfamily N-acetyltransferase